MTITKSSLLGLAAALGVIAVALTACGPSEETIQRTVDAKIREAINAVPTATPQPTPTPLILPPSPTPQPTPTPIIIPPTVTPITFPPTPTPQPPPTPQPTATPFVLPPTSTPQPTATPFQLPPTPTPFALPPTPTAAVSAATIYNQVRASVARVTTVEGLGSGVYIGENFVLTAAHVVINSAGVPAQTSGITVELNGQRIRRSGTLVGWDRRKDVAVLRLESDPAVPVQSLRRTGFTGVGETIFVVGYPLGATGEPVIAQGVISRFFTDTSEPPPAGNLVQYDAASAAGGSGSPLFDAAGRIISIHQVSLNSPTGQTGFRVGISSDDILDVLDALKRGAQG